MKKIFNYVLECGFEGCATDDEIKEMCVEHKTTIVKQELASYYDCLEWVCEGVEIAPGMYKISDGAIEVTGEEEDWEIVHISNKILHNFKNVV